MSFREKLEKKWKITIALLSEASVVLCECQGVGKYIAEYDEYLDHNELELALDMLEEAALEATSKPPKEIWVKLKEAAKSMGLEDRCEFYDQQIQNS
ncbi:hypothetical protein EUZ85_14220 [Hahella sp. KA22]|uniref:hypothetical protein n=1 Tax=Hahella sp. KA22 TaxID=1628392 RepID=UPI000FDD77C3|nr:hypothetical protein [Hahella sp. KA22]AZZ91822.1 hypothetical protein ENC22_11660 [Hahella sp. KA22]QAY55192.1 hypothetical protein EUZ85_14220 [Hahella sp. KA22]